MAHTIVIFGASGDLTRRKLVPALFKLFQKQRLPADTRIVGVSRREYSHDQWRDMLAASTREFTGKDIDGDAWREFAKNIYYSPGDIGEPDDFVRLSGFLGEVEGGQAAQRMYYLSTAPNLYAEAVARLGDSGLAAHGRVVIEKPFGEDQQSARELNKAVHDVFDEHQVYRIDHYLGKETVQNLLVLRFANSIFEPLWNRTYIDHVEITVAESVDVSDRGTYFDATGVLRDMFQNHLLQLLTITAMEAPVRYEADLVRDEKVKVLRAVRPMEGADFAQHTFRGQYEGYRDVEGVAPDSRTATFAALKLSIDNWRWQGVPFYLRSGKAMSCRTTQIVIQFREPPHMLFGNAGVTSFDANRLVVQIQPAEGIQLHFQTKQPDAGMRLTQTDLEVRFDKEFRGEMPDAYQRLLLDALQGDASLFTRSDEVELAWRIIDPILASWNSPAAPRLYQYPVGMWGPLESTRWIESCGGEWFDVCPVL